MQRLTSSNSSARPSGYRRRIRIGALQHGGVRTINAQTVHITNIFNGITLEEQRRIIIDYQNVAQNLDNVSERSITINLDDEDPAPMFTPPGRATPIYERDPDQFNNAPARVRNREDERLLELDRMMFGHPEPSPSEPQDSEEDSEEARLEAEIAELDAEMERRRLERLEEEREAEREAEAYRALQEEQAIVFRRLRLEMEEELDDIIPRPILNEAPRRPVFQEFPEQSWYHMSSESEHGSSMTLEINGNLQSPDREDLNPEEGELIDEIRFTEDPRRESDSEDSSQEINPHDDIVPLEAQRSLNRIQAIIMRNMWPRSMYSLAESQRVGRAIYHQHRTQQANLFHMQLRYWSIAELQRIDPFCITIIHNLQDGYAANGRRVSDVALFNRYFGPASFAQGEIRPDVRVILNRISGACPHLLPRLLCGMAEDQELVLRGCEWLLMREPTINPSPPLFRDLIAEVLEMDERDPFINWDGWAHLEDGGGLEIDEEAQLANEYLQERRRREARMQESDEE
jgi:hypothetical protein